MTDIVVHCDRCGLASATDAQFCQRCGNSLWSRSTVPVAPAGPRYAGFWIRAVAFILDYILLTIVGFVVRPLLGHPLGFTEADMHAPGFAGRIAALIVLTWIYRAGMESSQLQGTVGKLLVQIKVTDLSGNRVSLSVASIRFLGRGLSNLTLGIGFLMAAFNAQKQALHDKLAGTLVLYR